VLHVTPHGSVHIEPIAPQTAGEPVYAANKALSTLAFNPTGQQAPLADLAAAPAMALAGIAKPEVFFDMLRERGATLAHTWTLLDHHMPDADFYSKLTNELKRQSVFMTEKDAVKLFPYWRNPANQTLPTPAQTAETPSSAVRPHDLWAVPLVLNIDPAFFAALDAKLSFRHGHQTA
jgi:tetraacyldisaccharide 4'-kinase